MQKNQQSNEIKLTRLYDAPIMMVWDAWIDVKQVSKWWGPRGFTLTSHSKELKVGGTWLYTMHGPDGVDYPNKTTYHEIEKYSRLVYDHGASEITPPLFRVIVTFTELKNKTKMDLRMILATPEAATETKKFIKKAGGNATWDRLAEYLSSQTSDIDKFFINRSFDAPIDTVFEMWTNPKHFTKWLPPPGFSMQFIRAEIKVGGSTFYSMTNGADITMYGKTKYLEITKPLKLVYTQEFCDKDEKIVRHPLAPTWPAVMLTTVHFESEENDSTRITIDWTIYGDTTSAERETFNNAKAGMTMGWTGSFDKLEEVLKI